MAKTSKTMANRKRPPPAANGVGSGAGAPRLPLGGPLPTGIDALLAKYARHLPPGGTLTVRLVKGPTSASVDPIAARREAAKAARLKKSVHPDGAGHESDGGGGTATGTGSKKSKSGINAPLTFPRMAKFVETVSPPDFAKGSLKDGRLYEEEVPKLKDESDEEESTAYKPSNSETGGEGEADPTVHKKKKRRWRRNDPRPVRWVLQEKAEFFDRIRKRRQRSIAGGGGGDDENEEQGISQQYHGVVESNASKYVILSVAPAISNAAAAATLPPATPSSLIASEHISIQPIQGFHTFSQPYKFSSLSMEEAEIALEGQRKVVTRYMMHGKLASNAGEAKGALAAGGGRGIGSAPKAMSRARLLGKLSGGGRNSDGEDDDVMGDVRYSSGAGGGGGRTSRARRELVSTMGDEGTTVDDDGVLGGTNDSEFGGRRRFAKVSNKDVDDGDGDVKKAGGGGGKDSGTATGFDAGAMEEGFYQRDVAKEYEALDYDANEQFDNDDVNIGEDEMMDDGGGYGAADYDSGGDNMLDSEEDEGSDEDAFGGMSTSSGLKAMLAKARGESLGNLNSSAVPPSDASDASAKMPDAGGAGSGSAGGGKVIDNVIGAAKNKTEKKQQEDENKAAVGIEKDKDGKRLITLEAVRREIWLNNGAITSKRLMKKFDVTRKNPHRQALFKQIVLELCTMKKDADGNKLVLKQHYSKI